MTQRNADQPERPAAGTSEWLESYRESLARITGVPKYVDVLAATCRALQTTVTLRKEN